MLNKLKCSVFGHNYQIHSNKELTWRYLVAISQCTKCGHIRLHEWVRGKGASWERTV
ncbi:MAG: protein of unknown function DUF1660 [Myoviridae sp. ctThM1]|nr:MAG: protein of unknown function DUF1660 [Myoviridae sp. ctThM1]